MRARIEQVSPRMTDRMQLTLANCLQVNAMVKRHELLRGRPYQGDLALLEACVGIIVHCTALLIDLQASRQLNENFYDDDGNPWEPWEEEELDAQSGPFGSKRMRRA